MIDLGGYDARRAIAVSDSQQTRVFRRHFLRLQLMRERELFADDTYASSRGLRGEVIAAIEYELNGSN